MRIIVYGAGGVGGTIGARLHMAGVPVVLIARGEHLAALERDGLDFVAPDGAHRLSIPVAGHPREVAWGPDDLVLLTMKTQHTVVALDELARSAPRDVPVVCGQNGVANERMALRRFPNVYGMLVNLPALHLEPGTVLTHASGKGGILDTGRYPHGSDDVAASFTAMLERAGFSAVPDARVMRKKYAKLLGNLGNIVQAATATEGVESSEVLTEVHRHLRREALACFAAAGIDCASAEEVRARRRNVYRMAELPGHPRTGGSSWQSFSRGTGNVETDYLNGEIVLLGRLHGVPVPANALCVDLAVRMLRDGSGPGCFEPSELLAMIESVL